MTTESPVHVGAQVRTRDGNSPALLVTAISGDKAHCDTAWHQTLVIAVADLEVIETAADRARRIRESVSQHEIDAAAAREAARGA